MAARYQYISIFDNTFTTYPPIINIFINTDCIGSDCGRRITALFCSMVQDTSYTNKQFCPALLQQILPHLYRYNYGAKHTEPPPFPAHAKIKYCYTYQLHRPLHGPRPGAAVSISGHYRYSCQPSCQKNSEILREYSKLYYKKFAILTAPDLRLNSIIYVPILIFLEIGSKLVHTYNQN